MTKDVHGFIRAGWGSLLVALAVAGCSRPDDLGPVADLAAAQEIRAVLGGGEEQSGGGGAADSVGSGWATLKGRFVFGGAPPGRDPKQGVTKDLDVCAPGGQMPLQNDLLVGSDGGLQNVAIFLRRAPRVHEEAEALPGDSPVFDQQKCIFMSHVFACRVGQEVILQNSDRVGHNTKIEGASANQFNQIIEANASLGYTPRAEEAVPAGVFCSIHPWMNAYILPRKDGYYAVTSSDGAFEIPNLPAGTELEFQVWHEKGTGSSGGLVLADGEAPQLGWNSRGRFKITLTENETRELELSVPPGALGL